MAYQCRDIAGAVLHEAADMGDARDWHERHPDSAAVTKGAVVLMVKPGCKTGAKMLADRYTQARGGGSK
jgi:hypothetical protein